MTTNWKKIVEITNEDKYKWPEGWDTKATVARALDCTEDQVDRILKPAIDAQAVMRDKFMVWDRSSKRVVTMVGYQRVEAPDPGAPTDKATQASKRASKTLRVGDEVTYKGSPQVGEIIAVNSRYAVRWPNGSVSRIRLSSAANGSLVAV